MTGPLTPPLDLITTAVLDLLDTPARKVWDGAYGGPPIITNTAYGILYAVAGGDANPFPDLDDRNDTVTATYQVTAVSRYRNQCQQAARAFRDLMVGKVGSAGPNFVWTYAHPLDMPAGWTCIDRRPDPGLPGVDRTGEHPNALFTSPARYLLTIAPDA